MASLRGRLTRGGSNVAPNFPASQNPRKAKGKYSLSLLTKKHRIAMLQLPSSELAQRFSDMWASRALELGVKVSGTSPIGDSSGSCHGYSRAPVTLQLCSRQVDLYSLKLLPLFLRVKWHHHPRVDINSLLPLVNYMFRRGKTSLLLVVFTYSHSLWQILQR
ncbi:hypothetical protein ARMSODRAFT_681366 [Armillaria solidipes]|uniref:Uncharacterized protein n=1 Tax=Armillaria solidipes TaxID=1076256 RepID=A0A2H3B1G7_9AGAR|nr:hypothetical protein ARMSODRAFT_681366 [Armillaria solidipes]